MIRKIKIWWQYDRPFVKCRNCGERECFEDCIFYKEQEK